MLPVAVVIVAFAGDALSGEARQNHAVVLSDQASFNPLPEMWGLRELDVNAGLGDLDESLVLFLTERTRLETDDSEGQIYFAGGRPLVAEAPLTASDIADHLNLRPCLCALEYESSGSSEAIHIAAGAYRVERAPTITATSGAVRVECTFATDGQPQRTKLRSLTCWVSSEGTLKSLATALPSYARWTRKVHPGFLDPPMDDRPVLGSEMTRAYQGVPPVLALAEGLVDFEGGRGPYGLRVPARLDGPEFLGTARPGLTTWLVELRTGRKLTIDHTGYFLDLGPHARRLDRQHGIRYRDATYWP